MSEQKWIFADHNVESTGLEHSEREGKVGKIRDVLSDKACGMGVFVWNNCESIPNTLYSLVHQILNYLARKEKQRRDGFIQSQTNQREAFMNRRDVN